MNTTTYVPLFISHEQRNVCWPNGLRRCHPGPTDGFGDLSQFVIDHLTPDEEDEFFRILVVPYRMASAVVVDTMIASALRAFHPREEESS